MSIETAKSIVRVFGPCQLVHWRAKNPDLLKELLLIGCDAYAVGPCEANHPRWIGQEADKQPPLMPGALLEINSDRETTQLLQMLLALPQIRDLCLIARDLAPRKAFENAIFSMGWRRHPASVETGNYESLQDDVLPHLSFYQRIPAEAAKRWPIQALAEERNLHMDMLRESGCRADAHVVRYALAATLVRPGDTVLDCACGLGYGSAIVAATCQAAKVIGVDADANTIAYAQANYGGPNVSFQVGDAASLDNIPDASVDFIVSMETIEHVADWHATIAAFARVLKPDGRLIASVPDRWVDETGQDPNRYHVFNWDKLRSGLIDDFVVERRFIQEAPGGFKLTGAARKLRPVSLTADVESEWILVVASANPFARTEELRGGFVHPAFGAALEASGAAIVDFGRYYDNPWLYRTLVQMGERLGDDGILARLADLVMNNTRAGSADQGAALCAAGYRILEQREAGGAADLIERIGAYHDVTADPAIVAANPHVQRWRISSAYLAGRLAELSGAPDDAAIWFSCAANLDWRPFSPLLATKTVGASFHAARLRLARGDENEAASFFRRGLKAALDAAASDPRDIVGTIDTPIPFGCVELAEVMDMGGQCATALSLLPLWRRSPGAFWQKVDMKRFGLATWAKDVEAENKRLTVQIAKQAEAHRQRNLTTFKQAS